MQPLVLSKARQPNKTLPASLPYDRVIQYWFHDLNQSRRMYIHDF